MVILKDEVSLVVYGGEGDDDFAVKGRRQAI
jgi:hypothetical protein